MPTIAERPNYRPARPIAQLPQSEAGTWEYPLARMRHKNRTARLKVNSGAFLIEHRGKHWAVVDATGQLICLTVYKRGAEEVVRRLTGPL